MNLLEFLSVLSFDKVCATNLLSMHEQRFLSKKEKDWFSLLTLMFGLLLHFSWLFKTQQGQWSTICIFVRFLEIRTYDKRIRWCGFLRKHRCCKLMRLFDFYVRVWPIQELRFSFRLTLRQDHQWWFDHWFIWVWVLEDLRKGVEERWKGPSFFSCKFQALSTISYRSCYDWRLIV